MIVPRTYENVTEVLQGLKGRGCTVDRPCLADAMKQTGLHRPLSDLDLDDLMKTLTPQVVTTNRWSMKLGKRLSSDGWTAAVVQARLRSKLPVSGISEEEARARHDDLLSLLFSDTTHGQTDQFQAAIQFWRSFVSETRDLCVMLPLDPKGLDGLRAAFAPKATGSAQVDGNVLIGLRKLLNPEGFFKFGG